MNKKTIIMVLIAAALVGGAVYNVMNPTDYKHPMSR